jgi:hypothetical protein
LEMKLQCFQAPLILIAIIVYTKYISACLSTV